MRPKNVRSGGFVPELPFTIFTPKEISGAWVLELVHHVVGAGQPQDLASGILLWRLHGHGASLVVSCTVSGLQDPFLG